MSFGLDPYHIALATIGFGIIISHWLPRFISCREPAASALLIGSGALIFALVPGMPQIVDPIAKGGYWSAASEIVVIIALFGTGLRIDRALDWQRWRPAMALLAVAMPLTIAALTGIGLALGLSLAAAVLLGACLAPTDPVLAAELQVGPPSQGDEHPVKFALTSEAGLNDALAFPFVYAAILLASGSFAWGDFLGFYVLYKIAVGCVIGAALGWVLGKIMFAVPRDQPLSQTGSAVVALAGTFATYGISELAEGYGFLAVFVAAIVLRREEEDHEFHRALHDFSEAIESALLSILLIALGGAIPLFWPLMSLELVVAAALALLVVRPVFGWIALLGCGLERRERAAVAFYGVRGLGSIFYLAYAAQAAEFEGLETLWALVALVIAGSTLLHGLTAERTLVRIAASK
ncbi:MAG: cation:proton antiporter [Pseudomonadota bacterium]